MMLHEIVQEHPKIFTFIGVVISCLLVYATIAWVIVREELKRTEERVEHYVAECIKWRDAYYKEIL